MSNNIEFTYILGGNLELFVTAEYTPEDDYFGDEMQITEVQIFSGEYLPDFESDDIYIKNNQGKFESLDSLLEEAAREELSKINRESEE